MQSLRDTIDGGAAQKCAREILDGVPPVVWFIRKEMRVHRKKLSLAQFRALVLIYRQPGASLSAVAEHVGSSLPTASRIVQGLVEQGLLTRQGCPEDRRQLALAVTDNGRNVLETAWSSTQGKLAVQLQSLKPGERQAVAEAMRLLKSVFGALGLPELPVEANGNGKAPHPPASATDDARHCIAQA